MVVVASLENAPPDEMTPDLDSAAPLRPFVRDWKFDELIGEIDDAGRGRSFANGQAMFVAASCSACHRMGSAGGIIGPELTDVAKRFKRAELLRELLEPSRQINEKFQTQIIETNDGELITGVVVFQDEKVIRVMSNPLERCGPKEVRLDNIASRENAKLSLMPVGLMTTLTKEDIWDLIAYVESGGNSAASAFQK
jgi:putative heme-binding domain-containing protein